MLLGGSLRGELDVETGKGIVLLAHVCERQVGENETVLLVPPVRLLEKLDRPTGLADLQVLMADPAEIPRELARARRAGLDRRGAFPESGELLRESGRRLRDVLGPRGGTESEGDPKQKGGRERHASGSSGPRRARKRARPGRSPGPGERREGSSVRGKVDPG